VVRRLPFSFSKQGTGLATAEGSSISTSTDFEGAAYRAPSYRTVTSSIQGSGLTHRLQQRSPAWFPPVDDEDLNRPRKSKQYVEGRRQHELSITSGTAPTVSFRWGVQPRSTSPTLDMGGKLASMSKSPASFFGRLEEA